MGTKNIENIKANSNLDDTELTNLVLECLIDKFA